jgi:hypothetical protein
MGFRLPNRPPSNSRNDTQEQRKYFTQSGASRPALYLTIEWAIVILDHG